MELAAPLRVIERDGCVTGLEVQPQIIGQFDRGRPKPVKADKPPQTIECDRVLMAVGQAVGASELGADELPVEWGKVVTSPFGQVEGMEGVFCGGDCESGRQRSSAPSPPARPPRATSTSSSATTT